MPNLIADISMSLDGYQTGTPPFTVVTHSPTQEVRLEHELGMRTATAAAIV